MILNPSKKLFVVLSEHAINFIIYRIAHSGKDFHISKEKFVEDKLIPTFSNYLKFVKI